MKLLWHAGSFLSSSLRLYPIYLCANFSRVKNCKFDNSTNRIDDRRDKKAFRGESNCKYAAFKCN